MIVKVMICLPMSGKKEADINARLDEIMDAYGPYFSKKYGGVQWMVNMGPDDAMLEETLECASLYFLGRGLMECMSKSDIVLFDKDYKQSRGCIAERNLCKMYNKKIIVVNDDELFANTKMLFSGLTIPGVYKLVTMQLDKTKLNNLTDIYREAIVTMINADYLIIDNIPHWFDTSNSTKPIATVKAYTEGVLKMIELYRDLYYAIFPIVGVRLKRLNQLKVVTDEEDDFMPGCSRNTDKKITNDE